ncbi:hypothetical protein evm_007526 [Chilo suppressalis]|nr:hypothetical protein evm_007526 [Chilo suppressalis]
MGGQTLFIVTLCLAICLGNTMVRKRRDYSGGFGIEAVSGLLDGIQSEINNLAANAAVAARSGNGSVILNKITWKDIAIQVIVSSFLIAFEGIRAVGPPDVKRSSSPMDIWNANDIAKLLPFMEHYLSLF